MIGKYVAAAVIAVACLTSGCAPVHRTSRSVSDTAKTFATLPDKAVVYVYRNTLFGAAISMAISVDGVEVGATGAYSFFKLALPPGHHTLESDAENDSILSIDVQAGQNYYVWQDVKIGIFVARTGLHIVTAEEGQAEVRKLKLLDTRAPQFRMPDAAPGVEPTPVVMAPDPASAKDAVTAKPPIAVTSEAMTPAVHPAAMTPKASVVDVATSNQTTMTSSPMQVEGGLAVLDARIEKPMFVAAQDIASLHQCERLIRVRTVDGNNAHFYSACPGSTTPIEIVCNGASCHEGAPQG
jgi:hypothetical protein